METLAWVANSDCGKGLRCGGSVGGCRTNAEIVAKLNRRSLPAFALAPALAPRPGTRMRTLPEQQGRLASR